MIKYNIKEILLIQLVLFICEIMILVKGNSLLDYIIGIVIGLIALTLSARFEYDLGDKE